MRISLVGVLLADTVVSASSGLVCTDLLFDHSVSKLTLPLAEECVRSFGGD